MAAPRPSKRRRLSLSGSQDQPICLSGSESENPDCKHKSKARVASEDADVVNTDTLNHFLNSLDKLERSTHLDTLKHSMEATNSQLASIGQALGMLQAKFLRMRHKATELRNHMDQLVQDGFRLDVRTNARRHDEREQSVQRNPHHQHDDNCIARVCTLLEDGETLLCKQGILIENMANLGKALEQSVHGLKGLLGFWTAAWNFYNEFNEAGTTTAPRRLRELFENSLHQYLEQDLARIGEQIRQGDIEAVEAQTALAIHASTHQDDMVLEWAFRVVDEPPEVLFSMLCQVNDIVALGRTRGGMCLEAVINQILWTKTRIGNRSRSRSTIVQSMLKTSGENELVSNE